MILLIALTIIFILVYWYFTQTFNYFKKQGIPGPKPVPFFGNWWGVWDKCYHQEGVSYHRKYGKIYGVFDGRTPNLIIADKELMRKVFIKDFDHFTNRQNFSSSNEYIPKLIGFLKDEEWKDVRRAMSPAFTSSKMKKMEDPMTECAMDLVAHVKDVLTSSKELNIKELTTGYALDIISTCSIGLKIQSLWEYNTPFVQKALKVITGNTSKMKNIMYIICVLYPKLANLLGATGFEEMNFFVEFSKQVIKDKNSTGSMNNKNNYLELLLEASKTPGSYLNNEKVLFAQVLMFLLAGFEPPATAMSFILHCIAMHEDVQNKLREEIRLAVKKHGKLTYDCIQDMEYLDQCISEGLRLYPPNSKGERLCNKTVVYDNIRIEKGIRITLPVHAMLHDPEIYPEPTKFDPERFSPEEKAKRDPLDFVPFGVGPRNCIGMRLAMDQIKIGITHLIHNFRFYPSANTLDPPRFLNGYFPFAAIVSTNMPIGIEQLEV